MEERQWQRPRQGRASTFQNSNNRLLENDLGMFINILLNRLGDFYC
jgi:hypothetical protein